MERVLVGAGGRDSVDVVLILRKSRQENTECVAQIEAERVETDPRVFTHILVHFIISGKNLDANRLQHAIKFSVTKYCSASIMFAKTAKIAHDFEIREVK
jgi:putative redox protein